MIRRAFRPNRLLPIFALVGGLLAAVSGQAQPTLVWSDEFDTPGLPDPAKWSYDVGGGGWGNNELQYYTDADLDNARVEDGVLIIEARQEESPPSNIFGAEKRDYTSARLVSKSKGDWQYGRFEIRAKLPAGRGTWPAIWMLSTGNTYGGWPESGEMDIMEHVGYDMHTIHGSLHNADRHGVAGVTQSTVVAEVDTTFHVYALEWRPDEIRWFVDDVLFQTAVNPQSGWEGWPYIHPFHLIMNVAVGGTWGGAEGVDPSIWPQRMEVDYVRVYDLGDSPVLDADGDELIDADDPDDDNDNLSDLEELEYATNPHKADTDGDGFTDGAEVAAGSNPTNGAITPDTPEEPKGPVLLLSNADFSEGFAFWGITIETYDATGASSSISTRGVEEGDLAVTPEGVATLSHTGPRSIASAKFIEQGTLVSAGLEPGDVVTFSGVASSSGNAVTEAMIVIFDAEFGTVLELTDFVPISPAGGEFSMTKTLGTGDVFGITVGFRILAQAGTSGTITFSNLSANIEKPSPAEVFDLRLAPPSEATVALSWETWYLTTYEIWSSPDLIDWTRLVEGIEGNGARRSEVLPVSEGRSYFKVTRDE